MLAWLLLPLGVCLLGLLRGSFARGTRFLEIQPRYQALLHDLGLREVDDFFRLPAVIVCGHRNRHTAEVVLGRGADVVRAYIKREQFTYWRDYFTSVWNGLGWVSRSCREARLLKMLHRAGVPCPELIAAGEDHQGRAFVLVRELSNSRELGPFLRDSASAGSHARRALARRLGETLAHMHWAGFQHADLYSKHVHVGSSDGAVHFLDWQRARYRHRIAWRWCLKDLAALDATLAEELATPRERMCCVRAYLRASTASRHTPRKILATIQRYSAILLQKRHIREARHAPQVPGAQNLIWLDGEALCVTREFLDATGGGVPAWLLPPTRSARPANCQEWEKVEVPRLGEAILLRGWTCRPFFWLWRRLRGQSFVAPEMRQAALLFRLQRYGLRAPRLLAVGQRHRHPWRIESFLLLQPPRCRAKCVDELSQLRQKNVRSYRKLLREIGTVVRRLHESGCFLAGLMGDVLEQSLGILSPAEDGVQVGIRDVTGLHARRRPRSRRARRDLQALSERYVSRLVSRSDAVRFLRGYLGPGTPKTLREQVRHWLRRSRP
jgi:tRNA A-37 threonylcarbamoyl transferase component Bud32